MPLSYISESPGLIARLLTDLKSSRAAIRQCSALSLGCVQYATCPEVVSTVVTSLLHQLDSTAKVSSGGAAESDYLGRCGNPSIRYTLIVQYCCSALVILVGHPSKHGPSRHRGTLGLFYRSKG